MKKHVVYRPINFFNKMKRFSIKIIRYVNFNILSSEYLCELKKIYATDAFVINVNCFLNELLSRFPPVNTYVL